jgi:hypothetical protein
MDKIFGNKDSILKLLYQYKPKVRECQQKDGRYSFNPLTRTCQMLNP